MRAPYTSSLPKAHQRLDCPHLIPSSFPDPPYAPPLEFFSTFLILIILPFHLHHKPQDQPLGSMAISSRLQPRDCTYSVLSNPFSAATTSSASSKWTNALPCKRPVSRSFTTTCPRIFCQPCGSLWHRAKDKCIQRGRYCCTPGKIP